jgi:hypothetical protein
VRRVASPGAEAREDALGLGDDPAHDLGRRQDLVHEPHGLAGEGV